MGLCYSQCVCEGVSEFGLVETSSRSGEVLTQSTLLGVSLLQHIAVYSLRSLGGVMSAEGVCDPR